MALKTRCRQCGRKVKARLGGKCSACVKQVGAFHRNQSRVDKVKNRSAMYRLVNGSLKRVAQTRAEEGDL